MAAAIPAALEVPQTSSELTPVTPQASAAFDAGMGAVLLIVGVVIAATWWWMRRRAAEAAEHVATQRKALATAVSEAATVRHAVLLVELPEAAREPRILFVDEAFERATGIRLSELSQQSVGRLCAGAEDRKRLSTQLAACAATGRSIRMPLEILGKAGAPLRTNLRIVFVAGGAEHQGGAQTVALHLDFAVSGKVLEQPEVDMVSTVADSEELELVSRVLRLLNRTQQNCMIGLPMEPVLSQLLGVGLELSGGAEGVLALISRGPNGESMFQIAACRMAHIKTPGLTELAFGGDQPANAHLDFTHEALHRLIHSGESFVRIDERCASPLFQPGAHSAAWAGCLGLRLQHDEEFIGILLVSVGRSGLTPMRLELMHNLRAVAESVLIRDRMHDQVWQVTRELTETQKRFHLLVERSEEGFGSLEGDSIHAIYTNPAFKRLFGLAQDRSTFAFDEIMATIDPQQRSELRSQVKDWIAGPEETFRAGCRVPTGETEGRWIDVRLHKGHDSDSGRVVVGLFSDVTLEHEHQEKLDAERRKLAEANQQLQRAIRAKDLFLASMSHELRTPLTGIITVAEVITSGLHGTLTPKQEQYLRIILDSGVHLLDLINDILDISKAELGTDKLQKTRFGLKELCDASLRFVVEPAQKRRIRVSAVHDNSQVTICADQRRLKQILVNLLGNAVKFTPEGGEVTLRTHADPHSGWLQIEVVDTGIGISKEDQQRLFQPFTQLDSSLSRKNNGTGLGLCLVKHLTQLHGGEVSLVSEPGNGSCFVVQMPVEVSEEDLPTTSASSTLDLKLADAAEMGGRQILLADDNLENARVIQDFLTLRHFQVEVVQNGREAVESVLRQTPDLVLMDVQMPEMDGLEATRRIRALTDHNKSTVPIIAMTALAMEGDEARCLSVGASHYMSKPVSLRRLDTCVRGLLSANDGGLKAHETLVEVQ